MDRGISFHQNKRKKKIVRNLTKHCGRKWAVSIFVTGSKRHGDKQKK